MAAGSTYTPIATQTLGSAAASITFNSIVSTYTDLVLIISGKSTASLQVKMTFNGDNASTNYSQTTIAGNGSSASSARTTNAAYITPDYYYSFTVNGGVARFNIMNYSNTTTYKTVLMRSDNADTATMANVGLWRSATAIYQIDLVTSTSTFASGTTFTLYGIAAA
jgi:hypothetical protein